MVLGISPESVFSGLTQGFLGMIQSEFSKTKNEASTIQKDITAGLGNIESQGKKDITAIGKGASNDISGIQKSIANIPSAIIKNPVVSDISKGLSTAKSDIIKNPVVSDISKGLSTAKSDISGGLHTAYNDLIHW